MATTSKAAKAPAKKASVKKASPAKVFSDDEMAAMQAAKSERKKGSKADGGADLKAAIDKLSGLDRTIAEGIHAIVTANAPGLAPKTWYGLPAWANADGKAVIFLTPASKFKSRYAAVGFSDLSTLDDGEMWPTAFAITKLGDAEKKKLAALVKKAAG
ncbi:MAG: hypothetical protein ABIQ30_17740 [Devosia sp.]